LPARNFERVARGKCRFQFLVQLDIELFLCQGLIGSFLFDTFTHFDLRNALRVRRSSSYAAVINVVADEQPSLPFDICQSDQCSKNSASKS
jgi:hypothetical protein